jgi:hypothetical protein
MDTSGSLSLQAFFISSFDSLASLELGEAEPQIHTSLF